MVSKREKRPAVVNLTPDLLDSLPEDLRAALTVAIGEQELAEQRKKQAKARDEMYLASHALLEAGCIHVYEDAELEGSDLVPGDLYCPLQCFYKDLYGSDFVMPTDRRNPIVVRHPLRPQPLTVYESYEDLVSASKDEETFLYFGTFYLPESGFVSAKKSMMHTISGFAVDIDRSIFKDGTQANMDYYITILIDRVKRLPIAVQPDYVLLSGTAAQLWYTFDPVILQSKKSPRRKRYDALFGKLYRYFDNLLPSNACKVDVGCASINHAFRAPYTRSKLGHLTALYRWPKERRTDLLELSKAIDGGLTYRDVQPIDKATYERMQDERKAWQERRSHATEKQLAFLRTLEGMGVLSKEELTSVGQMNLEQADQLIKKALVSLERAREYKETGGVVRTTMGHEVTRKPRHPKLYEYTLRRIEEDTTPGNRYYALFVLATIAYNCNISRSRVERDMERLKDSHWGRKGGHDGKPVDKGDIEKALLGYRDAAVLRTRKQQEALLEWTFAEPATRNKQDRWTHLQADVWVIDGKRKLNKCKMERDFRLAEMRENGEITGRPVGSGTKEQMIKDYAAEHPGAKHGEIAKALGVSRPTVVKYLGSSQPKASNGAKGKPSKQQLVLDYLETHPAAAAKDIAEALGISVQTVKKWLKSQN